MSTEKQTLKVAMPLAPNGAFEVVDSRHTGYVREYFDNQNIQKSVTNVNDALEVLYNTVMAEPKMAYKASQLEEGTTSTYEIIEYKSKLNGESKISLPFVVDTPSIGDFVIQVERKPFGSTGAYEYYKTIKLFKTRTPVVDLGIATEAADMLYRLRLTDGAGKSAVTPWSKTEVIIDPDTKLPVEREVRIDYLEFRYSCSSVAFKPTPKDNLITKIFPWPLESFKLSSTISTGIAGYAYVLYQILPSGVSGPSSVTAANLQDWRHIEIPTGNESPTGNGSDINYLPSAVATLVDNIELSFSDPELTGEAGKYDIYCTAVVADTKIDFSQVADTDYKNRISFDCSLVTVFSIDALETNSASVTNQNTLPVDINTSSIVSVKPFAKTNVDLLTKINGLYLNGKVYYKAKDTYDYASENITLYAICTNPYCANYNKIDLAATLTATCPPADLEYLVAFPQYVYTATVTSGYDAPLWIISRPTIPKEYLDDSLNDSFELPCYIQINITATTTIDSTVNYLPYLQAFNITRDKSAQGVVTQGLLYNLDLINQAADITVEDHKIGETVINPTAPGAEQYSYGIKLFNTRDGSSGLVSTEEDLTYLAFTKNTYGVFYKKQGNNTTAFSPWYTLPLTQQTSSTYRNFTLEAYLRPHDIGNLNADALNMAAPQGIGTYIGKQASIKLESGSISYPLIADQWQHVVLTINEEIDTSNPLALNPYPTLRCYVNGVLVAAERFPTRTLGSQNPTEAMLTLFGTSTSIPPAVLNGKLDLKSFTSNLDTIDLTKINVTADSTGACDFKVLRFYNKALSADEILQNFITTQTDETLRAQIESRNSGTTLTNIYLVANKPITALNDLPEIEVLNAYNFDEAFNSLSADQQKLFSVTVANDLLGLASGATEDEINKATREYWRDYFLKEHAKWASYRSKVDDSKPHNPAQGIFNKSLLKEQYPTTFTTLNTIKTKATEFNNSGAVVHGSKTALVNCTMYSKIWSEDGSYSWEIEPDVDVYLQGTSSLAYPVKNYQIKVYKLTKQFKEDFDKNGNQLYTYKRSKNKIIPPGQSESTGWLTKDSVYTLKCDYMEHSHRNNTPTARFYQDEVLDYIIAYNENLNIKTWKDAQRNPDSILSSETKAAIEETKRQVRAQYSPARSIVKTDETDGTTSNLYRDAIDGNPCLLYFCDAADAGTAQADDSQPYITSGKETYAGSFMFNVDKAGAQLGFEIKVEDAINSGLLPNPDNAETSADQKTYFTNKDGNVVLTNAEGETFECIPCISYEGGANVDESAGAFLPFEALYQTKIEEYYTALVDAYSEGGNGLAWIDDSGTNILMGTYATLAELLGEGNYEVREGSLAIEGGDLISLNDFSELIAVGQFPLHLKATYTSEGITTIHWTSKLDVNDYIALTLEPRHAYNEEDDYRTQMYLPMREAIREIYNAAITQQSSTFTSKFRKYFDFNYCLTYYLQMMLFAQVDNAGKNAMFDIWGVPDNLGDLTGSKILNAKLGKFYPRPYDMDTQMGLNNSGKDAIPTIAEITAELSKSQCAGDMATTHSATEYLSNWASSVLGTDRNSANTASRFKTFNTSNSFLWKNFGKYYEDEIKKAYAYLRNQRVYDPDFICSFVDKITSQQIGEKFYNQDASTKYFSFKASKKDQLLYEHENDEDYNFEDFAGSAADLEKVDYYQQYLYCISGNRRNRYRQFLTDRIAFLDSYFSYGSMDDAIEVRYGVDADLAVAGTTKKLGETTYVALGISVHKPTYISIDAASSNALYTVLVTPEDTYKLSPGGDPQEGVLFWLPAISDTGDTEMYIRGCENIKELKHLPSLNPRKLLLSPAKKLTQLNLANCDHLAEFAVNSTKMSLLQNLNLSGTSTLEQGSIDLRACTNLVELRASGTKVAEFKFPENNNLMTLDLSNNIALTSLNLTGNDLLTFETLNISDCPTLTSLSFHNCSGLVSDNSKYLGKATLDEETGITSYYVLDTRQLTSLSLIQCPKLTYLDLSSHNSLASCILQLPELETLKFSASQGALFLYDASNPIQYPGLDLTACTALKTLKLDSVIPPINTANQIGAVRVSDTIKHKLTISLYSSALNAFTTSASFESGTYDFAGLSNTTVNLQLNKTVKILKNFIQDISKESFFNACSGLQKLQNCTLKVTNSGADSLFAGCSDLESLGVQDTDTTITFTDCLSGHSTCYSCAKLPYTDLKYLARGIVAAGATDMVNFARFWGTSLAGTVTLEDDFFADSNSSSVQLLTACFRGATKIEKVNKILQYFSNLSGADSLFEDCKALTEVDQDLFMQNTQLVSACHAFCNCSNLTTVFVKPTSQFFNSNNLTIIDGLFKGCTQLVAPADGFTGFFQEGLPNLTYARLAFYGCATVDKLSNDIFKNNNALVNIDGLFAGSMSNSDGAHVIIPVCLGFTGNALTSARGLFAGCKNLHGIVFDSLFGRANNTLQQIGSATNTETSTPANLTSAGVVYSGQALLGCFANTSIEGCTTTFIQNMTALKKCSALFCSATTSDTACSTVKSQDNFKGFIDEDTLENDSNLSIIGQLREELNNQNIVLAEGEYLEVLKCAQQNAILPDFDALVYNTKVPLGFFITSYLGGVPQGPQKIDLTFAGLSNLTGIQYNRSEIAELEDSELQAYYATDTFIPNNVISAAGLFKATGIDSVPYCIFSTSAGDGRALENINQIFADCKKLTFKLTKETFKGCNKLKQASAVFMNTKLQSGAEDNEAAIPATLFEECRNSLQNVSYMFANCKELSGYLGTGYAEINNETTLANKYSTHLKTIFNQLNTKFTSFTNNNSYKYVDAESAAELQTDFFKSYFIDLLGYTEAEAEGEVFNIIGWLCNTENRTCPNSDPENPEMYIAYTLRSYQDIGVSWEGLLRSNTKCSFDSYKKDPRYKVYTIKQLGLLGDCTKLTSVEGMFLNCNQLYGPIPADMFACTPGKSISLASLDFLFCGCSRLASYVSAHNEVLNNLADYGTIENSLAEDENDSIRIVHASAGNYKNVYPAVLLQTDTESGNDSYFLFDTIGNGAILAPENHAQYFVPEDWLESVTNIQSINHTFSQIGTFQLTEVDEDGNPIVEAGAEHTGHYNYVSTFKSVLDAEGEPEGYPLRLILPNALFKSKPTIKSACYTFFMNFTLGNEKSILDNTFMSASVLNSLVDITGIFAGSSLLKITSSDATKCFLYSVEPNTKLKQVTDAFAYMNNIQHSIGWTQSGTTYAYTRIPIRQMAGSTIIDLTDSNKFKALTAANSKNRAVRDTNVFPYYKFEGNKYTSAGVKYDPFISGGVSAGGHAWWSLLNSSRNAANTKVATLANTSFSL